MESDLAVEIWTLYLVSECVGLLCAERGRLHAKDAGLARACRRYLANHQLVSRVRCESFFFACASYLWFGALGQEATASSDPTSDAIPGTLPRWVE